jgi:hypothetical protein
MLSCKSLDVLDGMLDDPPSPVANNTAFEDSVNLLL